MTSIRLVAGVSTLLIGWAVAAVSTAQQAPAAGPPSTAANPDGLETIVVTAGKRAEDIQSVPSSISAISGAELESRHIDSVEDIARAVPGISFGAGGNAGKDTITIRGISSQGGNATVGQYLDDVPIVTQSSFAPPSPTSGAAEPKIFDLDRIEVLRGPQGTLYGAGSLGGTIRYITKSPNLQENSVSASADVSYTKHANEAHYETTAVFPLGRHRR